MTLYVDASALLKLYVDELESEESRSTLLADPHWVTAAHTVVEVRRNLARLLDGEALHAARVRFELHWRHADVVELDETACIRAAELAEETGVRTLDALHLGAAERAVGEGPLPFLTYDRRQAEAARSLGWTVLGA